MRIVITGLTAMSLEAARAFAKRGDDVILIDPDQETFEDAADDLDVAFIKGDGARPDVLSQANPEKVDVMYCLNNDDKDNIIAALVGKAAGVKRVILKVEDRAYQPICDKIGLDERVDPAHAMARALVHMGTQDAGGFDEGAVERDARHDGGKEDPAARTRGGENGDTGA
ncbi:potassium channel family protein [Maricaulaceae bacterium MS644]